MNHRFPVASGLEWAREADFLTHRIENPPGRPALDYRLGTWFDFLTGMMRSLRVAMPPGTRQAGARPPLARLNLDGGDDWVTYLLRAWSVVGDVLTFYTERMANEGYLRTAQQNLSVRQLVALLDYRPQPGAAAVAPVRFTLSSVRGMPARLSVPRGARIQSLPADNRRPQTWETVEPLLAQAEWNALAPHVPVTRLEQTLTGASTSLLLDGAALGRIKGGDGLLILARPVTAGAAGAAAGAPAAAAAPYFRIVRKVDTPRPARGARPVTRLTWQGALAPAVPELQLTGVEASVLRRAAGLFGRQAPAWAAEPAAVKQQFEPPSGGLLVGAPPWTDWQPAGAPLPAQPPPGALAAAGDAFAAAVTGKGIYLSFDGGASWQQQGQLLARKDLRSLLVDGRGYVFAGTADGLVLRSVDRGATWEALAGSIVTRKGKRWQRTDTRLPRTAVRCLAALPTAAGTQLVAGTDQGVWKSVGESGGWQPASEGLPGVDPDTGVADVQVFALASGGGAPGTGVLFAGTSRGVYRSANQGASWSAANGGLPDTDAKTGASATAVAALAAATDARTRTTRLLAGTARGVLRSTDLGESWQPANVGLPGTDPASGLSTTAVGSLAGHVDRRTLATYLFAGTPSGLFVSGDGAASWARAAGAAAAAPILGLAVDGGGTLVAATPPGDAGAKEWPGFAIQGGTVDLDGVYAGVVPGGWLVLRQGGAPAAASAAPAGGVGTGAAAGTAGAGGGGFLETIAPIRSVQTVERHDFTLDQIVTRLGVDPELHLGDFDLRTATAFVQSEPLTLAVEEVVLPRPLAADRVQLAQVLTHRFGGRRLVAVAGKHMRASFRGGAELAPAAAGVPPRRLDPTEEVQVLGAAASPASFPSSPTSPASPAAAPASPLAVLRVQAADGTAGTVSVAPAAIVWRGAAADAPAAAEVTEAEDAWYPAAGDQPAASWLLFAPPLSGCFDLATVQVQANVAPASQGSTIAREVLGSGDSGRSNQSFTLGQPVTYVPAPTPTGTASTLEVRVDEMLYREVAQLAQAAHYERVYKLSQNAAGRAVVTFGDGVHGARLPTGRENVTARYRTGTWDAPLVAGQLMVLLTRPLGLRTVANPLPVPPGASPEPASETRVRAPLSVRTLGRVVSATDYEDFARSFTGIAKARARALWTGSAHLMQVTVAAAGGREMTPDDPVMLALGAAVRQARAAPAPFALDSYQALDVAVALSLLVERARRPAQVEAAVGEALAAHFDFAASAFGQAVTPAEVTAVAQGVPGVLAAQVASFGPAALTGSGTLPVVEPRVQAREARYDRASGRLFPAELLRLAPASIQLTSEVAA